MAVERELMLTEAECQFLRNYLAFTAVSGHSVQYCNSVIQKLEERGFTHRLAPAPKEPT